MLTKNTRVYRVTGLKAEEEKAIKDYLLGAVRTWTRDRKNREFAARDMVGGNNKNWEGTPLQILYDKHRKSRRNHTQAHANAAKELGHLLKAVLRDDKRRTFEPIKRRVTHYKCI